MSIAAESSINARADLSRRITACGVIAVVRLNSSHQMLRVAESLLRGSVNALEITLTTPGALQAIASVRAAFPDDVCVGAGSVLDLDSAQRAIDAGVSYLVSPIMVRGLIEVAHDAGAVTMVGAFTPTEMKNVHAEDTDFVKLFPADTLGPSFLKGVLAPMPSLRVVPTGGITAANAAAWIRAGATAVGAGSSLVDQSLIDGENWIALTERARVFSAAVREARGVKA